jgi:membrane-associated phospholipid phosphatase
LSVAGRARVALDPAPQCHSGPPGKRTRNSGQIAADLDRRGAGLSQHAGVLIGCTRADAAADEVDEESLDLAGASAAADNPRMLRRTLTTLCSVPALAWASVDSQRRLGDQLSLALPAGTLAATLWRGDRDGAWQLVQTFVLTTATTQALKQSTGVMRPDGTNDQSFPSGHAARAFSAAAYLRQRHGLDAAWPLYVAATYVGYTRVQARRHRWGDVVAAAALAEAFASWRVLPMQGQVQVAPAPQGLQVSVRWRLP